MQTISDASVDLIVREEDSDPAYYRRHYEHFEWPAGASGPTVGIGYDCGYVTERELRADWAGLVEPGTIEALVAAIGHKGEAAHAWVRAHGQSVTITWDQALAQFKGREVPKWIARVAAALPNTDRLSPDALGALVSLSYNRGCSYDLPGARYAEMRAIKQAMIDLQFGDIPDLLRAMARLWTGGVARRRAHEAALFEQGLASCRCDPAAPVAPVPTAAPAAASVAPPASVPAVPLPAPREATVDDLRPHSRKLRLLGWLQQFLGLGGTTFTALSLTDVVNKGKGISNAIQTIGADPVLLVVVGACTLGIVAAVVLEAFHVDDYNGGRWQPSGGRLEPGEPDPA